MQRRTLVSLAVAGLLLAVAAALGFARASTSHSTAATKRILQAPACPAGTASERDADARGGCLPLNKPESSIESVLMAGERTARQTMPFDTVAPGAAANALAQRSKKPKTGSAWQPIGQTPLHADSPDYAGSDPVVTAGPSLLGWKTLSGRITAFASDPANPSHVFAAPATGGLWESTAGGSGWRQVGDGLPSQSMGGVAFSSADGGTILVGPRGNPGRGGVP